MRQLGFSGARYDLRNAGQQPVLTAHNTGGALRWAGTLTVGAAAAQFQKELPLLTLFVVFLVFQSLELHA